MRWPWEEQTPHTESQTAHGRQAGQWGSQPQTANGGTQNKGRSGVGKPACRKVITWGGLCGARATHTHPGFITQRVARQVQNSPFRHSWVG